LKNRREKKGAKAEGIGHKIKEKHTRLRLRLRSSYGRDKAAWTANSKRACPALSSIA